jgi:hypothetical protein
MCEISEAVKAYVKAQSDLSFRIGQHRHALQMGYTAEAQQAQGAAVNALYDLLIGQAKIVLLMEKMRVSDTGEIPVSLH